MAHLIQDGFVVNDAKWKLGIFVTDLNISREILVKGDLTIGNLMMQLVEQIGENQDWSDHALWWPDRRKWLVWIIFIRKYKTLFLETHKKYAGSDWRDRRNIP